MCLPPALVHCPPHSSCLWCFHGAPLPARSWVPTQHPAYQCSQPNHINWAKPARKQTVNLPSQAFGILWATEWSTTQNFSRPKTHSLKEQTLTAAAASNTKLQIIMTFLKTGIIWTWLNLNTDESEVKSSPAQSKTHMNGSQWAWPTTTHRPESDMDTLTDVGLVVWPLLHQK